VLTGDSVDPYNGKCVRASAGSLFHLPVCVGGAVADDLTALRAAGLRVLAADGHSDLDLDRATDAGLLDGPTAWVFGNEAWGLPETTRALADEVVRVPIYGRAESLNLATAAAVCLYASARVRRGGAVRPGAARPSG
jgi:TrmH family RNA methyltransferase